MAKLHSLLSLLKLRRQIGGTRALAHAGSVARRATFEVAFATTWNVSLGSVVLFFCRVFSPKQEGFSPKQEDKFCNCSTWTINPGVVLHQARPKGVGGQDIAMGCSRLEPGQGHYQKGSEGQKEQGQEESCMDG